MASAVEALLERRGDPNDRMPSRRSLEAILAHAGKLGVPHDDEPIALFFAMAVFRNAFPNVKRSVQTAMLLSGGWSRGYEIDISYAELRELTFDIVTKKATFENVLGFLQNRKRRFDGR